MNSLNRRRRRKNASPATQTSIMELPEAVLLHIISLIPTFDAIRTAAVAPPWRHLWYSLPVLNFSMIEQSVHFGKRVSDRKARRKFAEFVTQALRNRPHHLPIQTLKIVFFYGNTNEFRPIVDSWIHMIVELRVVNLDLDFIGPVKRISYDFRFSEILNSSIEVLRLQGCTLVFPGEQVYLHSIRELHLGPHIGNAGAVEQLFSSCIYLETFVFVFGWDSIPDLNIVSGSLRRLHISGLGATQHPRSRSVEICIPRLDSLELVGVCLGMYTIKDVSSLVEAKVTFDAWSLWDFASWTNVVSSLSGVERLTIQNINLDGDQGYKTYESVRQALLEERQIFFRDISKLKFGEELFSETFVFQNLKYLSLKTGYSIIDIYNLESILQKCPQLETLVLVCYRYTEIHYQLEDDQIADSLIALQIPRLREVRMEGYLGTKNELFVVDLLQKFGAVLEKIVLQCAR